MQTIKVKNGADIDIYTDDGVGIIVVRPNPEQLPPPAPQDVQPEGQGVGGAEEGWRPIGPRDIEDAVAEERLRCVGLAQGIVSSTHEVTSLQAAIMRQQPVAAGAPLGGAGDEELAKRFCELAQASRSSEKGAVQLAREAVAAERERCAKIVDGNCCNSLETDAIKHLIRSGKS